MSLTEPYRGAKCIQLFNTKCYSHSSTHLISPISNANTTIGIYTLAETPPFVYIKRVEDKGVRTRLTNPPTPSLIVEPETGVEPNKRWVEILIDFTSPLWYSIRVEEETTLQPFEPWQLKNTRSHGSEPVEHQATIGNTNQLIHKMEWRFTYARVGKHTNNQCIDSDVKIVLQLVHIGLSVTNTLKTLSCSLHYSSWLFVQEIDWMPSSDTNLTNILSWHHHPFMILVIMMINHNSNMIG